MMMKELNIHIVMCHSEAMEETRSTYGQQTSATDLLTDLHIRNNCTTPYLVSVRTRKISDCEIGVHFLKIPIKSPRFHRCFTRQNLYAKKRCTLTEDKSVGTFSKCICCIELFITLCSHTHCSFCLFL